LAQSDEELVADDSTLNNLNDSFVDDWSMVELSEEEKARTFLKPTASSICNKTPSFMQTSSTIIKDTMRKVLKSASGGDTGLRSSSNSSGSSIGTSEELTNAVKNDNNTSTDNGKKSLSELNSAIIDESEGSVLEPSSARNVSKTMSSNVFTKKTYHDQDKTAKVCNKNDFDIHKNGFNDDENSPLTLNTTESTHESAYSSKRTEGICKSNTEETTASSLLYPLGGIAKHLSKVCSGKPESPMLVVNSVSSRSQTIPRTASSDKYRNGIWSMAFKSFAVGDAVMFIKNVQYDNVYTMFQHGAKHPIFLNEDCIEIFKKYYLTDTTTKLPSVISGRIILVEDDQKATRHDNPYHLPHSGDVFGTVTVERLSESIVRNIEPCPDRSFSTDFIACGTTNLFVLRADDGAQKGVYIMLRHTDKSVDGVPYFLDLECVAAVNSQMKYVPNYILGETICVEERIASGNDQWGVAAGERYGLCTVTPLL
jgi:hypothetical protein